MNDFEKYILENKEQLQPDSVDHRVWLSVENAMLRNKNTSYRKFAIVVLVALVTVIGLGAKYYMSQPKEELKEEKIIAELNLSQYNFTQQVNLKKQQLSNATLPQDKLDDVQILLQQLEFMDEQFQDYRLFIEENGYQEFIGEQIIIFYESKIKLLDKIQKEVEKINYYENKKPSNSKKVSISI
jgi:hypothetical protein